MKLKVLMAFHGSTSTTRTDPKNIISILESQMLPGSHSFWQFDRNGVRELGNNRVHCFFYPGVATSDINLRTLNFRRSSVKSRTFVQMRNLGVKLLTGLGGLTKWARKKRIGHRIDQLHHLPTIAVAKGDMRPLISLCLSEIRNLVDEAAKTSPPELELILIGWSRGGVACSALIEKVYNAVLLGNLNLSSYRFHLFLIDPCNGPGSKRVFTVNPRVQRHVVPETSVEVLMTEQDSGGGFDVMVPEPFEHWHWIQRRVYLPGVHGSAVRNDPNCRFGNFFPCLGAELSKFIERTCGFKPNFDYMTDPFYKVSQYWKYRVFRAKKRAQLKLWFPRNIRYSNNGLVSDTGIQYFVNEQHRALMQQCCPQTAAFLDAEVVSEGLLEAEIRLKIKGRYHFKAFEELMDHLSSVDARAAFIHGVLAPQMAA